MFLDDSSVKGLRKRAKQVKECKNLEVSAKIRVSSGMKLHEESSGKHFCLSSEKY